MHLVDLKLKEIHPSDKNTRADYNGTDMAELIKSIEHVGLLNPIIVRPVGDMGYEIVAGHRRFHAVQKMGRDVIPARIMETTDQDAQQIRMIENLHRKDLNAIEEAEAFRELRVSSSLTTEGIANLSDKSIQYVTRALALLEIPNKVVEAIRSGQLTAEHGHQIARLTKDKRDAMAKFALTVNGWTKQPPTLIELKREIEKKVEKDLKNAVFPKDRDYAEEMSCEVCPFNGGNQGVLFDGAKQGSCTNPSCFTKKTNTFYRLMGLDGNVKWPGVKYLGAKSGHTDAREFAGFPIVDPKNAKIKERLAKSPDKFFFGIFKKDPSGYGRKKAELVLVSADKSEEPEQRAPDRDWEKERWVNERVKIVLIEYANKEVPAIQKKHLIQMMTNENDEVERLSKKSMDELLKMMWLGWLGDYNLVEHLLDAGFDAAKIKSLTKIAAKEAEKMYDADKASKEKKNND